MKKVLNNKLLSGTLEAQAKRIARMKSRKDKYTVLAGEKELIVLPKVFYPGRDSILIIETMKYDAEDVVLDSCSGTGIIAVFAAAQAKKVFAVDASEYAVCNIKENAAFYEVADKVVAEKGNLFPQKKQKFDKIVINPPYTDNKAKDVVEKSVWDEGHRTVISFFKEAKDWLKEGGKIYLSWANFADFDFIEKLAQKSGYTIRQIAEAPEAERKYKIYEIEPRQNV